MAAPLLPPPTGLVATDLAVERYGTLGRHWIEGMAWGDPLADAVAGARFPGTTSTAAVRRALSEGPDAVTDAPSVLHDLFAQLDDEPTWADHDAFDRAADTLVRYTPQLGIVLAAASLLSGAANSIAGKPLVLTGRYQSQPAVRSLEVGEWLNRVLTPSGMKRDGAGFEYTVRVRMIHAHVRRGLSRQDAWDHAAWGTPIPQPYMAFTLAEFGHIALAAMERMGVRLSSARLDDIYLLWRYVGHVVGMDERLNPTCEADHIRIEELYRLTSPGPSEADRAFVDALTDDYLIPQLRQMFPARLAPSAAQARWVLSGLQRHFLGAELADDLGIPDTPAQHLLPVLRPALAVLDRGTLLLAGGRARAARKAYAVREQEMARMRAEYAMTHDLVDAAPSGAARDRMSS